MRVRSVTQEADAIFSFDLRPRDGGPLPPFAAGAHIGVELPCGERCYSLVNPQEERHRYVIAVRDEPGGGGGSRHLCRTVRPGDLLRVGAPLNNFPLDESVEESVLVAGGIGITPLWAMIQRLQALGRKWRLHYAARGPADAAFLAELEALEAQAPGRVRLTFDGAPGAARLDLGAVVASLPPGAHIYCCGPAPMLEDFSAATSDLAPERVHLEHFAPAREAADGGFEIELARSGRTLFVPVGKTILEVLLAEGIRATHSCSQGVCGACEVRVLAGTPDHRDVVLSARQKAESKTMMICRSGSLGPRLVLDI